MNVELIIKAEAKKDELTQQFPDNWLGDTPCNYVQGYLDVLLDLVEDFHNGCNLTPSNYEKDLLTYLKVMEKYQSDDYLDYPQSNDKLIIDYLKTLAEQKG